MLGAFAAWAVAIVAVDWGDAPNVKLGCEPDMEAPAVVVVVEALAGEVTAPKLKPDGATVGADVVNNVEAGVALPAAPKLNPPVAGVGAGTVAEADDVKLKLKPWPDVAAGTAVDEVDVCPAAAREMPAAPLKVNGFEVVASPPVGFC